MVQLRVRLAGFDPAKTRIVHRHLPKALEEIERLVRRRVKFPSPVRPMRDEEIAAGRKIRGPGHEEGAGHGIWDAKKKEVRVNPHMDTTNILLNIVHEMLHSLFPHLNEPVVDKFTDRVAKKLNLIEDYIPQTFYDQVAEGLTSRTRKRLRKLNKKRKKLPPSQSVPFQMIVRASPYFMPPVATLPGPGSFGPTSIGGIIRHS